VPLSAGHVGCYGLNFCLGSLQTHPKALESLFSFSLANMYHTSGAKIKDYSDVLVFLAQIDLVDGNVTDFLEIE